MLTEAYRNLVYANANGTDLTVAPSHQGLYMPLPAASDAYTRYLNPCNGHALIITESNTYRHGCYTVTSSCDADDATDELSEELFAAGYAKHNVNWFKDPIECEEDPDDVSYEARDCYSNYTDWSNVVQEFSTYEDYREYWASIPFSPFDLREYAVSFAHTLSARCRVRYESLIPQQEGDDPFNRALSLVVSHLRACSYNHIWPMRLDFAPNWHYRDISSYDASVNMRRAAGLPDYPSRTSLGQSANRLQWLNNYTASCHALPIYGCGTYVIDHIKHDDGSALITFAGQPTNCGTNGWICFGDNNPADYSEAFMNYFEGRSNWDLTSPLHLLTPWLIKATMLYQDAIGSSWPEGEQSPSLFEGSVVGTGSNPSMFALAIEGQFGRDLCDRKEFTVGVTPIIQRLPAGSRLNDDIHGIVYVTAPQSPAAFLELQAAGFPSSTHVPGQSNNRLTLISLPVKEQLMPELHPTALLVTQPDALGRSWVFLPPTATSYGATLLGQLPA